MRILNFSTKDIGVDLGTANILITLKGKGIVLTEPSVVAIDCVTSEIVATGYEAKEMLGRTPEKIKALRPMQDGAIADLTATSLMLKNMIKKVLRKYNVGKPKAIIGVPTCITEVEEKAVIEAVFQCGAKEVYLVDEPMASAIGAGINVAEPKGNMIVDIGGGTTEVAVISLGGIVTSTSIKTAGNAIDDSIIRYLKKYEKIAIGQTTAEKLKIELGSAEKPVTDITREVRGRDIETGLPKNAKITSKQIEKAMQKPVGDIIEAITNTLAKTEPELVSDIMENGIYLAGGGAQIKSLDNLIAQKVGIQTYIADAPLNCVAVGTGRILENTEKYNRVIESRKTTK